MRGADSLYAETSTCYIILRKKKFFYNWSNGVWNVPEGVYFSHFQKRLLQ